MFNRFKTNFIVLNLKANVNGKNNYQRALLTYSSQSLSATAGPAHTENAEVWPASTNRLQAAVTKTGRLLAKKHLVKFILRRRLDQTEAAAPSLHVKDPTRV